MSRPSDLPSLFADAIEIPRWLDRDRETPYAIRLHRDRIFAAEHGIADPLSQVRAWWRDFGPRNTPDAQLAARLERGRRLITLLMMIVGAFAGVAVASAVFHYDGTWPVNVVTVVAVLVLLQLSLVLLTCLMMLPRLPGLKVVQDLLGAINPAAIVAAIYGRTHKAGERPDLLFDWQGARGPTSARFARWQVIAWSQFAAVMFNIAVLATAIGLIAFTDLAFGWSTTLQLSSREALHITDALASPWRSLWSDAVPDARLIEESRFFRLASGQPSAAPAIALTGWWPFLLACVVTYGLIPRAVLLALSQVRLYAATKALLLDDARVKALLDRMAAAEVALGAEEEEPPAVASAALANKPAQHVGRSAAGIVWSTALPAAAVPDWARLHLHWRVTQVLEAGGGRPLASDAAVLDQIAGAHPDAVLVFVRGWEAPLLDLQDFLALARSRLGAQCSLIVVPVGPSANVASDVQSTTWSRWTAKIADPALYLETGA